MALLECIVRSNCFDTLKPKVHVLYCIAKCEYGSILVLTTPIVNVSYKSYQKHKCIMGAKLIITTYNLVIKYNDKIRSKWVQSSIINPEIYFEQYKLFINSINCPFFLYIFLNCKKRGHVDKVLIFFFVFTKLPN